MKDAHVVSQADKSAKVSKREKQRARNSLLPLVMIDPGHGGEELGAVGIDGLLEKDVVLDISLILDEMLRERLGIRTALTRASDVSLTLAERTEMANEAGADLFISIHTNASSNRRAYGIETYYLDNTNDKSSLKLAERENYSAIVKQPDLQFILSDLIQNAKLEESIALAHYVQDSLVQHLGRRYPQIRGLGVKRAPFYVLVGAHMPCVLVEVSFIDHPREGKRLASRQYQKDIAEALYLAVENYLKRYGKSKNSAGAAYRRSDFRISANNS